MSRNKDIKLLHEMTGLSYRKCRSLMKANGWHLWKALPIDTIIKQFPEALANSFKVVSDTLTYITETMQKLIEEFNRTITEGESYDN